ncbi:hypothetical protein TIFTF001_027532 [Ficus carica]|uniref:Uncharacterized protein n=1 Tax=Ficus carica TaxID=3494 RepID=A0AA88DN58_FICCA|nr:hypothetical protein TIFTF001_027532 [Ficus carica]
MMELFCGGGADVEGGIHLASHKVGHGWDELNSNDPEEDGSEGDTRCDSNSESMITSNKRGSRYEHMVRPPSMEPPDLERVFSLGRFSSHDFPFFPRMAALGHEKDSPQTI